MKTLGLKLLILIFLLFRNISVAQNTFYSTQDKFYDDIGIELNLSQENASYIFISTLHDSRYSKGESLFILNSCKYDTLPIFTYNSYTFIASDTNYNKIKSELLDLSHNNIDTVLSDKILVIIYENGILTNRTMLVNEEKIVSCFKIVHKYLKQYTGMSKAMEEKYMKNQNE
jgi:hypothetical protein